MYGESYIRQNMLQTYLYLTEQEFVVPGNVYNSHTEGFLVLTPPLPPHWKF